MVEPDQSYSDLQHKQKSYDCQTGEVCRILIVQIELGNLLTKKSKIKKKRVVKVL